MKCRHLLVILALAVPQAATSSALSQDLPTVLSEEEAACVICFEDCPVGQHVAVASGYTLPKNWHKNGGVHIYGDCLAGSCISSHGPQNCGGLAARESARLRVDLAQHDVEAVRSVLAAHGPRVTLNRTRSAVQLADCTGAIYAHLPIDAELLRALTE